MLSRWLCPGQCVLLKNIVKIYWEWQTIVTIAKNNIETNPWLKNRLIIVDQWAINIQFNYMTAKKMVRNESSNNKPTFSLFWSSFDILAMNATMRLKIRFGRRIQMSDWKLKVRNVCNNMIAKCEMINSMISASVVAIELRAMNHFWLRSW